MEKSIIRTKEYLELLKFCETPVFDTERAKYLLSIVDVNAYCSALGYTLLSEACGNDNYEMVKLLVEAGADVNQFESYDDYKQNYYSPVIWGLQYMNEEVEEESENDESALIKLDEDNNPRLKILRYLITHGAKVDIRCDYQFYIDYVRSKVFNDWLPSDHYVYINSVLKTLIALCWDLPDFFDDYLPINVDQLSLYVDKWGEDKEGNTIVYIKDDQDNIYRIFHFGKYCRSRYK